MGFLSWASLLRVTSCVCFCLTASWINCFMEQDIWLRLWPGEYGVDLIRKPGLTLWEWGVWGVKGGTGPALWEELQSSSEILWKVRLGSFIATLPLYRTVLQQRQKRRSKYIKGQPTWDRDRQEKFFYMFLNNWSSVCWMRLSNPCWFVGSSFWWRDDAFPNWGVR